MGYLSIKNIKKSFNKNEVLKGIDIEINKGELVCFLGPSGCGKTTLLRIIAGLESQNSGEVVLEGKDISNLPPSKRNIGIVFQNYALFPNLTIFENIAYGLRNRKVDTKTIDEKVNQLLNLVELNGMENKYPTEISGGQQQRVALARAIVLEPEILLLDEPLSALDAKVRESLREEIKSLQRKLNITTIMVTHDQEEALTMGDKIVVFNNGNAMQIGTPEEIYYNPANDFTADFVGKINIFKSESGSSNYLRPECFKVSKSKDKGFIGGKVTSLEFRGSIYRIRLTLDSSEIINVDLSYKEINELSVALGDTLYIKSMINFEDKVKKEVAADEEK